MLQSRNGATHAPVHAPPAQVVAARCFPAQLLLQLPQFEASLLPSISHPSSVLSLLQSRNGATQAPVHALPAQVVAARCFPEQLLLQLPQFEESLLLSISHPSVVLSLLQSRNGATQAPVHALPAQVVAARCFPEQLLLQLPQFEVSPLLSVSHPSVVLSLLQSKNGATQAPVQALPTQLSVAKCFPEQLLLQLPQFALSTAV